MQNATGTVFYHASWEPKPAIRIDVGGVPGRRIDPPLEARQVAVLDARGREGAVDFAADGLVFLRSPSQLRAVGDFADAQRLARVYDPELEALVARELGAIESVVFDHTVRTDRPGARPPARHAHGDYTPRSARQRLRDVLGEARASEWAAGHFGIVNAWRPLARVERAPLAFARPDSVSAEDWVDVELIYPHRRGQVTGLMPSQRHEWVYLSDMGPEEVALFRVHDSEGRPAVAHSAVDLDTVAADAALRQSIESRILVRYE